MPLVVGKSLKNFFLKLFNSSCVLIVAKIRSGLRMGHFCDITEIPLTFTIGTLEVLEEGSS